MLQNQRANSYSQPALPVNTKASPKHAGSEKSSSPTVQHNLLNLKAKQAPPISDTWSAVSKWLATSQTFEKPPTPPASIADDPAPLNRRSKQYWLQVSQSLDLRIESRAEQSKHPIHLNPGSVYTNPSINNIIPNPAEHTPPGQLNTTTNTALPLLPNTMGPAKMRELEGKCFTDANISEVQEKLAKHKREQEKHGQLEAINLKEANEAVEATAKQLATRKVDEAVKAKAKKLAADAMARYRTEQERKKYVEGRVQDIHKDLLQYKPFNIDGVRREFSEQEVQDIKQMVRDLGFAKKK